jgi:hypothetical protein
MTPPGASKDMEMEGPEPLSPDKGGLLLPELRHPCRRNRWLTGVLIAMGLGAYLSLASDSWVLKSVYRAVSTSMPTPEIPPDDGRGIHHHSRSPVKASHDPTLDRLRSLADASVRVGEGMAEIEKRHGQDVWAKLYASVRATFTTRSRHVQL